MSPFTLPAGYSRVQRAKSFDKLVAKRFADGVNAVCWQRELAGDFAEIVKLLGPGEGIVTLDDDRLLALDLSEAGQMARATLLADKRRLEERDLDPVLNCIYDYPHDESVGPVVTDVFSFHADSAPVEAETWLCTYHGPSSEGLRNEQALRKIDVPATRAELLRAFGGEDGEEFRAYLNENCYDLHYAPLPEAEPFSFGHGNLWKIAVDWPGSPVPPCIHRAPLTISGQQPRLLMIC